MDNDNKKEVGRPKSIPTPELMRDHFNSYRKSINDNPLYIIEQRKASVNFKVYGEADLSAIGEEIKEAANPVVQLPAKRPLTMEGFENWLDENDIITDVSDYFENKDGRYTEFIPICSRIRKIIRQDQIEGGMVGIYNPSITARLNNLKESADITTAGEKINIPQAGPVRVEIIRSQDD